MGLRKRGPTPVQELEVKNNHVVILLDDKTTVASWGHSTPFSPVVTQLLSTFLVTQHVQLNFLVSQLNFLVSQLLVFLSLNPNF